MTSEERLVRLENVKAALVQAAMAMDGLPPPTSDMRIGTGYDTHMREKVCTALNNCEVLRRNVGGKEPEHQVGDRVIGTTIDAPLIGVIHSKLGHDFYKIDFPNWWANLTSWQFVNLSR